MNALRRASCFALCALGHAILTWRFHFLTDDAYISFRYAKNWADGHGLRFNLSADPPIEGFSNFLWVALSALVDFVGLPMLSVMPLLSYLCGLLLLYRLFRRLGEILPLGVSGALTLFLAVYPPFAVWSTSGMATMPFALVLFLATEELLWNERPRTARTAIWLLILALLRVEGIVWALALLVVGSVRRRGPLWKPAIPFALGYAAYFLARFSYFGRVWPNTVDAKSGMSAFTLGRGFDYVFAQWSDAFLPWIVIPAAVIFALRARDERAILTLVVAAGTVAYSIGVGGDFMVMGRFLLPGAALLLLGLGSALQSRLQQPKPLPLAVATLAIAALTILPGFDLHVLPESLRSNFHFRWNGPRESFRSEYEQWAAQESRASTWERLGKAFRYWAERPGETIVAGSVGSFAYYSELEFYDRNGLVTRLPEDVSDPGRRSPGHDRTQAPDFFLDRRPDFSLVSMELLPERVDLESERDAFGSRLERRALNNISDPEWVEHYVPVIRPLPVHLDPSGRETALYWRRIRGDESSQAAWLHWRDSLRVLVKEGRWI